MSFHMAVGLITRPPSVATKMAGDAMPYDGFFSVK